LRRTWRVSTVILLATSAFAGCREAVQRAVLKPADPSAGAASLEELAAAYKLVHRQKDLAGFCNLELSLCQLRDWVATPARQRAALEGLFELPLEAVRLERMPPETGEGGAVMYLRQTPQGQPAIDVGMSGDQRCGKLLLVGRTDGAAVELDPGLVVVRAQGRYYLDLSLLVAEDAAHAIRNGVAPRCRPFPLGTELQSAAQATGRGKNWAAANQALDALVRAAPRPRAR
jgi:hypothetical protein